MLSLENPEWNQLRHAYGAASDIPDLLRQLESFPPHDGIKAPPYFMLWSSLCHQGDVYTASYAAVPHIIRVLSTAPTRAHWDFFLLPACIEIGRAKGCGPEIPGELRNAYHDALQRIPPLAAVAAEAHWQEEYNRIVVAAIAVAKGQPSLGEAILELEPDTVKEFMRARFE
ncbi:MAG TPA: hypothetical protein VGO57_14335 [Verrucomicrobiae bacterium]|jgi:hypothetical protein